MKIPTSFELAQLTGLRLKQAKFLNTISYDDGGSGFEKILLDFEDVSIIIESDADTDQIKINNKFDFSTCNWEDINLFSSYIGHEFSWSWMACNSNGYLDALLISFDVPIPNFLIISSASMLSIYRISPA